MICGEASTSAKKEEYSGAVLGGLVEVPTDDERSATAQACFPRNLQMAAYSVSFVVESFIVRGGWANVKYHSSLVSPVRSWKHFSAYTWLWSVDRA
jgi:hypothetical protein